MQGSLGAGRRVVAHDRGRGRRKFLTAIGASWVLLNQGTVAAAETSSNWLAIVAPRDGATVTSPVSVVVDLNGAPVSDDYHGHPHLIIDSPLPEPGTMVPMDERHIHLTGGESTTTLTLAPGKHTLQLIMAGDNHRVRQHVARSAKLTITVK